MSKQLLINKCDELNIRLTDNGHSVSISLDDKRVFKVNDEHLRCYDYNTSEYSTPVDSVCSELLEEIELGIRSAVVNGCAYAETCSICSPEWSKDYL